MAHRHLININLGKLPILGRLKISTKALGDDRARKSVEIEEVCKNPRIALLYVEFLNLFEIRATVLEI
jgi:hypothetical protein